MEPHILDGRVRPLGNRAGKAPRTRACQRAGSMTGCSVSLSVARLVERIKALWGKGPASTLELAGAVSSAKSQLRHGQWTQLWKSNKMPFSKRQGYLLVAIGCGLGWANAHTCAHLPIGLRTLYQLSRLDRKTLERLIQDGVIHPALNESEAREVAARLLGESVGVKSPKPNVRQRLGRFSEFVRATLKYWQPQERESAQMELIQLADLIGAETPGNGLSHHFMNEPALHPSREGNCASPLDYGPSPPESLGVGSSAQSVATAPGSFPQSKFI